MGDNSHAQRFFYKPFPDVRDIVYLPILTSIVSLILTIVNGGETGPGSVVIPPLVLNAVAIAVACIYRLLVNYEVRADRLIYEWKFHRTTNILAENIKRIEIREAPNFLGRERTVMKIQRHTGRTITIPLSSLRHEGQFIEAMDRLGNSYPFNIIYLNPEGKTRWMKSLEPKRCNRNAI